MAKWLLAPLMAAFLLASFPTAGTPQEMPAIVVIETMPVPVILEHSRWFMKEMARLGYEDGRTATFKFIKAQGDKQRAARQLTSLLESMTPDAVVTFATLASQAACQVLKNTKVPVIFAVVSDPAGAGIIKKVGVPSRTNVTGLVFSLLRKTKVDMAMRMLTPVKKGRKIRFGIVHSSYPAARGDVRIYREIARSRDDVEFITHEIPYQKIPQGLETMLADFERGINLLRDKVDYWWQVSGPLGEISQSTELLLKTASVFLAYGNTLSSVKAGALFTINPDFEQGGRETAGLVSAVLKGGDPGEIPVLTPCTFDLGVNISTALKMKIAIPSDIMNMAGEKVFR